ncbi:MAG: hypothetical protein ACM3X6_09605 [Patescibacteria group bacterium]
MIDLEGAVAEVPKKRFVPPEAVVLVARTQLDIAAAGTAQPDLRKRGLAGPVSARARLQGRDDQDESAVGPEEVMVAETPAELF